MRKRRNAVARNNGIKGVSNKKVLVELLTELNDMGLYINSIEEKTAEPKENKARRQEFVKEFIRLKRQGLDV